MAINLNGTGFITGLTSISSPTISGGSLPGGDASAPGLTFSGDPNTGIYSPGADQIAISTNGTAAVTVDSSQRVGIGTTSPASDAQLTLDNGGSGDIAISLRRSGSAQGDAAITNTGSNITFKTGSSDTVSGLDERVRITADGKLLVGTSTSYNSTSLLQVVGPLATGGQITLANSFATQTSNVIFGKLNFISNAGSSADVVAEIYANNDGAHNAGDKPTKLVFSTTADGASSPTERMRITNDGAIQIGTTSDPSSTNFGTHIGIKGSGALLGYFATSRNVGATNAVAAVYGTDGLARVMGDGDLENTNNRYTGISDVKYKQNIEDASSQWDDIKAIQVRKYELIANPDRKHIGVIAQELEQICPGLVIERNEDDEGTETYKSVAYSVLYMKAVKALQEAMERIETLEAKAAALESA